MVVVYFEPGGGGSEVVTTFFQGGDTGGIVVRAETWVLTPRMERALSSFQNRAAQRFVRRHLIIQGGGGW